MANLVQIKVYLDTVTDEIVENHKIQGGFGKKGKSAALRNIIIEWWRCQDERIQITEAGREALRKENGS